MATATRRKRGAVRAAVLAAVRALGVTARWQEVRRLLAEQGLPCDRRAYHDALRRAFGDYARDPARRAVVASHGPGIVLPGSRPWWRPERHEQ